MTVFKELKEQSQKVLATPSETICSTMDLVSALFIQESEVSPDPDNFDPNSITARPISFYLPEKVGCGWHTKKKVLLINFS